MKAIFINTLLIFLMFSSSAFPNAKLTEENWQQHPQIKKIRKVYQNTESKIKTGKITIKKKNFEYCRPMVTERILFLDSKNRVLKYDTKGGSDDYAATYSYYYDSKERLRFIFIAGQRVHNIQWQERFYFDEDGKQIWKTGGSGLVGGNPHILHDPMKDFNLPNPCIDSDK